jgi:hypothetical protein
VGVRRIRNKVFQSERCYAHRHAPQSLRGRKPEAIAQINLMTIASPSVRNDDLAVCYYDLTNV